MEEALWYIGSILVLAVVSLLAGFERIDYEVERDFGFYRDQGLAQFKIIKSEIDIRNDYLFWADVSSMVYRAYIDIPSQYESIKEPFGEYLSFCQERVLNLGFAIHEGKDNQK